jgi:hypothetical protein
MQSPTWPSTQELRTQHEEFLLLKARHVRSIKIDTYYIMPEKLTSETKYLGLHVMTQYSCSNIFKLQYMYYQQYIKTYGLAARKI